MTGNFASTCIGVNQDQPYQSFVSTVIAASQSANTSASGRRLLSEAGSESGSSFTSTLQLAEAPHRQVASTCRHRW